MLAEMLPQQFSLWVKDITHLSLTHDLRITCALLGFTVAIWFVACRHRGAGEGREPPKVTRAQTPTFTDPNKDREHGEWAPVDFSYPAINPCPYELSEMKPIPYRPFRWGQYHVTMGVRNMPWDDWIELDNQFPNYHRIRAHRIRTRGDGVIRVMPGKEGLVPSGAEAAIELIHELAEYLSRRYPTTFRTTRHPHGVQPQYGWNDAPSIKTIEIVPVGETYELPLHAGDGGAVRALEISALLVQDDLALMMEGTDGKYYFQAGAICVAGFWRMQDKIGLPLDEIHLTGNVPQYKEKLHTSLERFFRRLPIDKPVIRNNYFVQIVQPPTPASANDIFNAIIDPEELAWSSTTNGPEDTFTHGHPAHPHTLPTPTPDTLRLRTERQTLRRLPRTGAVVFTIRTYVVPVEELGRERGVPGRMASAVRSWPEDVGRYKGSRLYKDVLVDYLEGRHRAQVESGEVGEEERRGEYPF